MTNPPGCGRGPCPAGARAHPCGRPRALARPCDLGGSTQPAWRARTHAPRSRSDRRLRTRTHTPHERGACSG
eukprot:6734522-Prymnesium_polylepis.1